MMGLAVWIAVGLAYRFFTELHAFRKLVHEEIDTGTWPLQGGGEIHLPHPSVACYYVFELRWMTYRHCFDILVLMTFTSVDLLVCILELCWTSIIACFAYCRCLCCFWCKGCCGICGWMICNCTSAICCLIPVGLLFLYIVSGLVGATICCILLLAGASALLVGFSLGLRYVLAYLTCCFCKPLPPASWVDQVMLLHPLPPGSPYFTTAMVVREPMNEDERQHDLKLQEVTPLASSFDVDEAHMSSDYTIWEDHLGMPMHLLNYAFPAWYTMTFIPSVLMTTVALAFLRSNEILFAKSMAESDLTWLPVGPTSSWEYHWVVLKAIFIGISDGFHGIFVDVPVAVVTEPKATFRHLWNIADTGIDVVNLFKADRRQSPTEPMDDGQFKGNFDDFEATVLLLRLILTVLFGCLRLTAMIARTPDKPCDESDGDEEEDSEDRRLLHRPHAVHAIACAKPATVGAAFAQSERWPLATALCSAPAGFALRRSHKRRRPCLAINNEDIYMDDFVSPGQMLRCRRSEQRHLLLPVLSSGWSRTDGLPRGQDAGFQFQNMGPLVGCPPSLWIYFVGSSAVPSRCPWQVQEVMLLFEQVCDSTQSYSLLTSASGCIASEHWRQDSGSDKDVPPGGPTDRLQQPASECSALTAQEVLGRYDLVVATDEGTRARVAALAGGDDERLCCLADFLDVCSVQDQISQLQLLWDRKGLACAVRPDARSVGRARSLTDLDDVDSSDLLLVAQALAVAGLERFLISQFPQGLKDRLHPHLVPKGI
ncbi:unnamed protein product [Symbiodinium sp. KB8]|nr:unnamed protein product [Symbiodinium sp. KB8]